MDLEKLKELAEKATPGPWWNESGIIHRSPLDPRATKRPIHTGRYQAEDDAAFIAAARTAVPELVKEVERLRYLIWMEDSWATKAVYADDDSRGDRKTTCRVCNETIRIRNWHEHLAAHPERQRWDSERPKRRE